jgi:hypothetical protein
MNHRGATVRAGAGGVRLLQLAHLFDIAHSQRIWKITRLAGIPPVVPETQKDKQIEAKSNDFAKIFVFFIPTVSYFSV